MQRFRSMRTRQKFSSVHPADLQTETLDHVDGVSRPCGVDSHLKEGACLRVDEPSLL